MGTQESSAITENDFNNSKMQKEFLLSMSTQNPDHAQPISNSLLQIPKNVKNFVIISSGPTNYVEKWSMENIFVCGFTTGKPPIPLNHYHLHNFKGNALCTIYLGKNEYQKVLFYMGRAKSYLSRTEFLNLIISFSENNEDSIGDFNKRANQKKPAITRASPTDPNVVAKSGNTTLPEINPQFSQDYYSNSYYNNESNPAQQVDKLNSLSYSDSSGKPKLQPIEVIDDEESENSVSVSIINSSQLSFSSENSPQQADNAKKPIKKTKKPIKGKKLTKTAAKEAQDQESSNKTIPKPKKSPDQISIQSKSSSQPKQLSSQVIEEEEYDESDNSGQMKKMQIDLTQTDSEDFDEGRPKPKSHLSSHKDNNSSDDGSFQEPSGNLNSPLEGNSISKMKQNRPAPLAFVIPKTGDDILIDDDQPKPNRKLNTISPSRLPSNRKASPNMRKLTIEICAPKDDDDIQQRHLTLSSEEDEDDNNAFEFTPIGKKNKKKNDSLGSGSKQSDSNEIDLLNSDSETKQQQPTKAPLAISDIDGVSKPHEKGPVYVNREVIEIENSNKDEKIISTSVAFTTPDIEINRQTIELSNPIHYHYAETEKIKKKPLTIAHKVIIDRYHKKKPIEICHMVEISRYKSEDTKTKPHQPKIIDRIAQLEDAACQRGIQAQLGSDVEFVIPSSEFLSSPQEKRHKHKSRQLPQVQKRSTDIPDEMTNYSSDLSQKEEQLMEHMEQQRIRKSPKHAHTSQKHSHRHERNDYGSSSSHFTETVKENVAKKIFDIHKKASQIAFDDSTSEKVMSSTESGFDVDRKNVVPPSPKFISPNKKERDTDVDNLFDDIGLSSELFRPRRNEH